MIKVVGAVMIAGSVIVLRALRPKDGRVSRLATTPVIEDVIPFGIVAGFAIGLVLILATGW
jgi:hypothetical protein